MNISKKKFQFIECVVSEEIIFYVFSFSIFLIMVSMATSTNEQWAKSIWLKQDF